MPQRDTKDTENVIARERSDRSNLLSAVKRLLRYARNGKKGYFQVKEKQAKVEATLEARDVVFKLDSELVVKQIHHKYSVKSPNIIPLYRELEGLLKKFQKWEVIHVPREEKSRADALANMGIDSSGYR